MKIDKALSQRISDYLRANKHLDEAEHLGEIYKRFGIQLSQYHYNKLAKELDMAKCKKHPTYKAKLKPRSECSACWKMWNDAQPAPEEAAQADIKIQHLSTDKRQTDKKYKALMAELEKAQRERDVVIQLKETSSYKIKRKKASKDGQATAVLVASDWHYEEKVDPAVVSDMNKYNLDIAQKRIEQFFRHSLRLIEIQRSGTKIDDIVLALLGDFITGSIHDELMESNQLSPVHALIEVERHLISGIEYLLNNAKAKMTAVCHSGNHGRATKEQRHGTEAGNSFERYMYHCIANHFEDDDRITFVVPNGYHSYVDIYDYSIRFHHGHALRYGGGIGGLYIPTNKAIAQWNKARRVDLDVFGHFHQMRDGGNFICNGSLIGYNAYALSIKAEYERASQTFFLVDAKRGRTIVSPILFDQ